MTAERILVVEDEESQSRRLRRMLKYRGYEVECAKDLTDVKRLLPLFKPALAVVDLFLVSVDDFDGFDVIRYVRSSAYSQIGILAWSANYIDDRDEIWALREGADDFVRKDAQFGLLEARIEALLRRVSGYAGI